ncbi:MAG: hypothetical protein AAFX05_05225 [Planctomycetota bacterium]
MPGADRAPILIIVGASLRAERVDRPLAYRLREHLLRWMDDADREGADVVVCTDLWYLHDDSLHDCWGVAVGPPERNAVTARSETHTPGALIIDGALTIRFDVELDQRMASCWGTGDAQTATAIDAFAERYVGQFMMAAIGAG